jgi:hypothetical protein
VQKKHGVGPQVNRKQPGFPCARKNNDAYGIVERRMESVSH